MGLCMYHSIPPFNFKKHLLEDGQGQGATLFGVAPALGGPGLQVAGELYLHFHHVDGIPAAFDFL